MESLLTLLERVSIFLRVIEPVFFKFLPFLRILLDEGEYVCPVCTVFGLEEDEVQALIKSGFKMTDHNKEDEGYEVKSSAYKVKNKKKVKL